MFSILKGKWVFRTVVTPLGEVLSLVCWHWGNHLQLTFGLSSISREQIPCCCKIVVRQLGHSHKLSYMLSLVRRKFDHLWPEVFSFTTECHWVTDDLVLITSHSHSKPCPALPWCRSACNVIQQCMWNFLNCLLKFVFKCLLGCEGLQRVKSLIK